MKLRVHIAKGIGYLARYEYVFPCGVWEDVNNLRTIIEDNSKGTRPWLKHTRTVVLELA